MLCEICKALGGPEFEPLSDEWLTDLMYLNQQEAQDAEDRDSGVDYDEDDLN
jgi:hypothetical protein